MNRTAETILDELLVVRAQAGDRDSLELLVKRHHARLVKIALLRVTDTDVALEIVQETWIAVVKGLRRINDPAKFPAWVDQMVRFKSVDWLRQVSNRRQHWKTVDTQEVAIADRDSAGPEMQQRERLLERMRIALKHLPASQRQLLSLLYLDGRSVNEIATILDVPAGTVKSRLFHARAALRKAIEFDDRFKQQEDLSTGGKKINVPLENQTD